MNRSLWSELLSETYCPPWPGPICRKGTVALVPKSLMRHETVESQRARGHHEWDPDWLTYAFTAWGECRHTQCKQQFAIAGSGSVGPEQDEEGNMGWEAYFEPMYCFPTIELIDLPKGCPDEVAQELDAAFCLYWSNRAACAGRIRVALELLLDHLGVQKKKKGKNGKFAELGLHARIELFAIGNPVTGGQLMALKSLGNSAAHEGSISTVDLLDAFEVLEHTLEEVIEKRSQKVAALAKKLNKKHS